MTQFFITALVGALGGIVGFLVSWGTIKQKVIDSRDDIENILEWKDKTIPLMGAAADARDANNEAVRRLDRRIDRVEERMERHEAFHARKQE